MQTQNRFVDDLARLLSSAAGTLSGVRNEMESVFRQPLERLLASMDLVSHDTFDALRALAQATRTHQENLDQRLSALEAKAAVRDRSSSQRLPLPHRRAATNLRQSVQRRMRNKQT